MSDNERNLEFLTMVNVLTGPSKYLKLLNVFFRRVPCTAIHSVFIWFKKNVMNLRGMFGHKHVRIIADQS